MSAADSHRYGFDDLRRLAAAMGRGVGLPPAGALAMASHLLWFDAAGAPILGIATLPRWLEAIEGREVDPTSTGRIVSERTALAVLDGQNGPTPLVLEQAAGLAVEKAREAAVGLVRVVGAGPVRSSAPAAAGIAIGPMAGVVIGPGLEFSLALPTLGGPPLVVDSGLAAAAEAVATGRRGSARSKSAATGRDAPGTASPMLEGIRLATEILLAEGGWLVAAVAVAAMEAASAFDERLASVVRGMAAAPGRLLPEAWEASRRERQRKGVAVDATTHEALVDWARRLAVDLPDPLAD